MNIGISLLAYVPCVSGGIGFYITNLIRSLQEIDSVNNYYLITNTENENLINPINRNFSVIKTGLSSRPQIRRVAWEQVFLPIFARRLNLDVLHCPSYTVPIFCRTARVVTICDMLYKDYPQTLGI